MGKKGKNTVRENERPSILAVLIHANDYASTLRLAYFMPRLRFPDGKEFEFCGSLRKKNIAFYLDTEFDEIKEM